MNPLSFVRTRFTEWRDAVPHPPPRPPDVIQFPVNDICNSRCQMCHIWQRKRDHEVTPDELDRILADPLFRDVRNVGMNGGEPTLRADLETLLEVMIRRLPRLGGVSLITNAVRPARVKAAIDALGRRCRTAGVRFDVMVSLDGVGEVHDRVRGVPGNFDSAVEVIDHIRTSAVVDAARIGCTIIAENVHGVDDVLEFAQARGVYARFRVGIPHPRLYTADLAGPFALEPGARFHLAAFLDRLVIEYETDPARRAFYRSLRDQVAYDRARAAGCAWKNHGVTLSSRGELSYCAVASPLLGDARATTPSELLRAGAPVLEQIVRERCSGCRHDYEGISNRRLLVRQWVFKARARLPAWCETLGRRVLAASRAAGEWRVVAARPPRRPAARPAAPSILLAGWYGTETLGDRAILAGLCRLIREAAPGVSIDVASLEPYVTRETLRVMPGLPLRAVVSLGEVRQAARAGRYAAVAMAGGPLMTPVAEVVDMLALMRAARAGGAAVGLLGCGIGPLGPESARRAAIRRLVCEADVCVLRDVESAGVARQTFGRDQGVEAACDPAFFWEELDAPGGAAREKGAPTVALALREWMTHEYAGSAGRSEAGETKRRFEQELVRMVQCLREARSDVKLLPVCMHTLTIGGDDRVFMRRLFAAMPDLAASIDWRRIEPAREVERLRAADVVCAMRFHSVVFSIALRRPFLAIDYTGGGKIAALAGASDARDRIVALAEFDGRKAAENLLSAASGGQRAARGPDIAACRSTYLQAIRALIEGTGSA